VKLLWKIIIELKNMNGEFIMENYNRIEKHEWGIYYYLNDKLHRLDGPAIEYSNGGKEWFQKNRQKQGWMTGCWIQAID
jgi:hypothetical protein